MNYNNFFILRIIFGKGRNIKIRTFVFIFCLFLFPFLTTYLDDIWIVEGIPIGFFEDIVLPIHLLCLFSVIVLSLRIYNMFSIVFKGDLQEFNFSKGILSAVEFSEEFSESDYKKLYNDCESQMTRKTIWSRRYYLFLIGSGILSNLLTQIGVLTSDEFKSWAMQSEYILTYISQEAFNFIVFGLVYPEILFLVTTSIYSLLKITNKITAHSLIILSPVSFDSKTGLLNISAFCLQYVKILFFPVLYLLFWVYAIGFTYEAIFSVFLLLMLFFVVFFYPIIRIHSSMLKLKSNELLKLEQLYRKNYQLFDEQVISKSVTNDQVVQQSEILIN